MPGWLNPQAGVYSWTDVGPASDELLSALSELYWEGLTREMSPTILAQKLLERHRSLPEENDVMKRLPESAFHFIKAWGKFPLTVERGNLLIASWSSVENGCRPGIR